MPPEHVLDKWLLMYVYKFKALLRVYIEERIYASKQHTFYSLFFCCAKFSSIQESSGLEFFFFFLVVQ